MKYSYKIMNGILREEIILSRVVHVGPMIDTNELSYTRVEKEEVLDHRKRYGVKCFFNVLLFGGTNLSIEGTDICHLEKDRKGIIKAIKHNDKTFRKAQK